MPRFLVHLLLGVFPYSGFVFLHDHSLNCVENVFRALKARFVRIRRFLLAAEGVFANGVLEHGIINFGATERALGNNDVVVLNVFIVEAAVGRLDGLLELRCQQLAIAAFIFALLR